jgi:hypothetical protein
MLRAYSKVLRLPTLAMTTAYPFKMKNLERELF